MNKVLIYYVRTFKNFELIIKEKIFTKLKKFLYK
jgi:hypothetical protein